VALNTNEYEYLEACEVAVWLQELLSGLFGLRMEVNFIWCDNQSFIVRLQFFDYRGSSCGHVYQEAVEDEV
jgi:hypothetical protein